MIQKPTKSLYMIFVLSIIIFKRVHSNARAFFSYFFVFGTESERTVPLNRRRVPCLFLFSFLSQNSIHQSEKNLWNSFDLAITIPRGLVFPLNQSNDVLVMFWLNYFLRKLCLRDRFARTKWKLGNCCYLSDQWQCLVAPRSASSVCTLVHLWNFGLQFCRNGFKKVFHLRCLFRRNNPKSRYLSPVHGCLCTFSISKRCLTLQQDVWKIFISFPTGFEVISQNEKNLRQVKNRTKRAFRSRKKIYTQSEWSIE